MCHLLPPPLVITVTEAAVWGHISVVFTETMATFYGTHCVPAISFIHLLLCHLHIPPEKVIVT